jgi:glycerol-3-phosphate acyltransferase PlsY
VIAALSFVMPGADALINLVLLLAVMSLVVWVLVTWVFKVEPLKTIAYAIFALVLVVMLLQTFTTWGG